MCFLFITLVVYKLLQFITIFAIFSDSHKIIVTPYMIETLRGMPKIGQNLLIAGKIRTQQFLYKDKRRTSIQVIAKQMYVCDDRYEKFHVKTPNKVELLAHICFDVSNEETYSVFVLAVHYKSMYVN